MPQPKGIIPPDALTDLHRAAALSEAATRLEREAVIRAMMLGGSFSEVSRVTGRSTNTLQRWVREAGGVTRGQAARAQALSEADEFRARLVAAEAAIRDLDLEA